MSNGITISENNLTIETSETLVNVLMVSESTVAGGAVSSVNGYDGAVILNPDDLDDSATANKFATAAQLAQIATNQTDITGKQATLVSGTNIKTINSTSLLGSGDIAISASSSGSQYQIQVADASSGFTDITGLYTDANGGLTYKDTGAIVNSGDSGKSMSFDVSSVTTGNERSLVMSDFDLDCNLINPDKNGCVYIGTDAGLNDDGGNVGNIAIGKDALKTNTGSGRCIAIGEGALQTLNHGFLDFGCVAIGYNSQLIATGRYNTSFGYQSLYRNTGNSNTAIGYTCVTGQTTGEYNTYYGAGITGRTAGNYATYIGAQISGSNTDNEVIIADGQGNYSYHDDNTTTKVFNPFQFVEMTTAQRTALANTANTTVYDTDLNKVFTNDGTAWNALW